MATAKKTTSGDRAEQQQKYWDGWFGAQKSFFEKNFAANSFMSGSWNDFFKQWQETMSTQGSLPGAETYSKMFAQSGEGFLKMLEQFYQSAGLAKKPEDAIGEWTAGMQKFYESILAACNSPADPTAYYKQFMDSIGTASPTWWTTMFNAPDTEGNHPHHTSSFLFDPFGFYASIPGIGYSREKQDHANKLYRLWADYQSEMKTYNAEMTKVGLKALKAFQDYIKTPPKDAAPLQSLKEIYVKWVDINEEIYAEYAMSDEYTQMYGDVVNALTEFKKQQHVIIDDMVEQFNLPTRAEMDSINQKTQILKRENAQLKKDIEALKAAAGLSPKKATAKKGKKK